MSDEALASLLFVAVAGLSIAGGIAVSILIYKLGERLFLDGDDVYPSEHGDGEPDDKANRGEIDDRWPWRGP